jgi:hypothetical protein
LTVLNAERPAPSRQSTRSVRRGAIAAGLIDIRLSKSLRFWENGRFFNVFNSSDMQTLNVTCGPA